MGVARSELRRLRQPPRSAAEFAEAVERVADYGDHVYREAFSGNGYTAFDKRFRLGGALFARL